jgi:TPR repeat protein
MRGRLAFAGLVLAASVASAQSADAPAPADVPAMVRQGQCASAVRALNEQLKTPTDRLLVFAGAIHEIGACVKRDWPRAESFYLQAARMGSASARLRLAAAYADAANGPDLGASLWWAHEAALPRPEACVVARFSPTMEPEVFVKAIESWGLPRVRACAYVGAVVAGTMADMLDSDAVAAAGPATTVRMSYEPGEGRFVARRMEAERSVEERRWRLGDAPDAATDRLGQLRRSALAAARRYAAPSSIDPSWRVDLEWQFDGAK